MAKSKPTPWQPRYTGKHNHTTRHSSAGRHAKDTGQLLSPPPLGKKEENSRREKQKTIVEHSNAREKSAALEETKKLNQRIFKIKR